MNNFTLKLYLYSFFDRFGMIFPFVVILYQDTGMTAFHIAIVLGVLRITQMLTEIPSGVVADKFSRKHVLLFAQLFRLISYFIWIIKQDFMGFVIAAVFNGLAISFVSGCREAFIYDKLNNYKRRDLFERVSFRSLP